MAQFVSLLGCELGIRASGQELEEKVVGHALCDRYDQRWHDTAFFIADTDTETANGYLLILTSSTACYVSL